MDINQDLTFMIEAYEARQAAKEHVKTKPPYEKLRLGMKVSIADQLATIINENKVLIADYAKTLRKKPANKREQLLQRALTIKI